MKKKFSKKIILIASSILSLVVLAVLAFVVLSTRPSSDDYRALIKPLDDMEETRKKVEDDEFDGARELLRDRLKTIGDSGVVRWDNSAKEKYQELVQQTNHYIRTIDLVEDANEKIFPTTKAKLGRRDENLGNGNTPRFKKNITNFKRLDVEHSLSVEYVNRFIEMSKKLESLENFRYRYEGRGSFNPRATSQIEKEREEVLDQIEDSMHEWIDRVNESSRSNKIEEKIAEFKKLLEEKTKS